jgi:hypothetical protein
VAVKILPLPYNPPFSIVNIPKIPKPSATYAETKAKSRRAGENQQLICAEFFPIDQPRRRIVPRNDTSTKTYCITTKKLQFPAPPPPFPAGVDNLLFVPSRKPNQEKRTVITKQKSFCQVIFWVFLCFTLISPHIPISKL